MKSRKTSSFFSISIISFVMQSSISLVRPAFPMDFRFAWITPSISSSWMSPVILRWDSTD